MRKYSKQRKFAFCVFVHKYNETKFAQMRHFPFATTHLRNKKFAFFVIKNKEKTHKKSKTKEIFCEN